MKSTCTPYLDIVREDFVVNYTKNDRNDVPHFLLSIPYTDDLSQFICLEARLIITTKIIYYILTTYYGVDKDRLIGIPYNYLCESNMVQNKIQFVFLEASSNTGSAMLIIKSGNTGSSLITGEFCYSEEIFNLEVMQYINHYFMPINDVHICGPILNDFGPNLKSIEDVIGTIASLIIDTPKDLSLIINCRFGLEFVLSRALFLLQKKGFLEHFFVDEPIFSILEQLGCGDYIIKYETENDDKRLFIFSSIGIVRNFGGYRRTIEIQSSQKQCSTTNYKDCGQKFKFKLFPFNTYKDVHNLKNLCQTQKDTINQDYIKLIINNNIINNIDNTLINSKKYIGEFNYFVSNGQKLIDKLIKKFNYKLYPFSNKHFERLNQKFKNLKDIIEPNFVQLIINQYIINDDTLINTQKNIGIFDFDGSTFYNKFEKKINFDLFNGFDKKDLFFSKLNIIHDINPKLPLKSEFEIYNYLSSDNQKTYFNYIYKEIGLDIFTFKSPSIIKYKYIYTYDKNIKFYINTNLLNLLINIKPDLRKTIIYDAITQKNFRLFTQKFIHDNLYFKINIYKKKQLINKSKIKRYGRHKKSYSLKQIKKIVKHIKIKILNNLCNNISVITNKL